MQIAKGGSDFSLFQLKSKPLLLSEVRITAVLHTVSKQVFWFKNTKKFVYISTAGCLHLFVNIFVSCLFTFLSCLFRFYQLFVYIFQQVVYILSVFVYILSVFAYIYLLFVYIFVSLQIIRCFWSKLLFCKVSKTCTFWTKKWLLSQCAKCANF